MKICIITVYNSGNAGSFLQAYSLQHYFQSLGHEVVFRKNDNPNAVDNLRNNRKYIFRQIFRLRFTNALIRYRMIKSFPENLKQFTVEDPTPDDVYDLYVIGSDTVWNIAAAFFRDRISTYFGRDLNGRMISYAAAVGKANEETFSQFPQIKEDIRRFSAISVRDVFSEKIIRQLTDAPIDLVCDPTWLLEPKDYDCFRRPVPVSNYIFVYGFDEMPKELEKKIIQFSRSHHYKIVTTNTHFRKAGKLIHASPNNLISYMQNAALVFTTTFHGSMFSLLFRKQVAFYSMGKSKVQDVVRRFHLEEHDYSLNPNMKLFEKQIDFDRVAEELTAYREHSKDFLNRVLSLENSR